MNGLRGTVLLLVWGAAACQEANPPIQLTRTDSSGIEVVRLEKLPELTDPAYLWRAHVTLSVSTVSEDSDEPLIYLPRTLLPLSDDRLIVIDQSDPPFVILDVPDQQVVERFGKRGRGPGEVWGPLLLSLDEQQNLRVLDVSNRKILRFTLAGELLEEVSIRVNGATNDAGLLGGQRPLIEAWAQTEDGFNWRLEEVDWDGDTSLFSSLPGGNDQGSGIQEGRNLWVALNRATVVMRSERPVFRVLDPAGKVIREVRLPLSNRTLTAGEIEELKQEVGGMAAGFEPGPIALTNGLFAFSDDVFGMYQSPLWRAREDPALPEDTTIWRLFSTDGSYQGAFVKPSNFSPMWVGADVMWGAILDESGIPVIEKRELISPEYQ